MSFMVKQFQLENDITWFFSIWSWEVIQPVILWHLKLRKAGFVQNNTR